MHSKSQVFLAELVGTFVLVFGGCGAAVLAGAHIGYLGVSLAFGLSLLVMAYAIGPISGCHINPAVSIGLALARKLSGGMLLIYIIAHPSKDAGVTNWAAFAKDPQWVKAKTESEAAGPIVAKVAGVYMDPVEYSRWK